jgi:hypothetical protein
MDLVWWDRLRSRMMTAWPPETFDRLFVANGSLHLEYRDQWNPYERPVLPFGLDVESLWSAEYLSHERRWKLKRLRRLDYEGKDKPP